MATDTSHLRNALATTRDQGNGEQAEEKPLAIVVRESIDRQADAFRAVLPAGVDSDRFARLTMIAIKANPKLMAAFTTRQGQTSVLLAVMQAAALGLEPNTPIEECWLQPRRRKQKDEKGRDVWVDEAELSIGYKGYKKLVRNAAASAGTPVKTIFAEVVREGDHFRWSRGIDADVLEHTPVDGPGDEEAPLTHVYAVVRFADGTTDFVVMNRTQVHKRRAMSDSWKRDQKYPDQPPRSPWFHWEPEQWRKTGIRTLCKQLNLSPQLERALSSDEAPLRLNQDEGVIEALPYEETAGELEQAPPPVEAAFTLKGRRADGVPIIEQAPPKHPYEYDAPANDYGGRPAGVDPETGEVDHIDATATTGPPPATPRVDDARGVAPADKPMLATQSRKLFALLNEHEMADDDDRHAYASATLGRDITSFKELTRADAVRLINRLEDLAVELEKKAKAEASDGGEPTTSPPRPTDGPHPPDRAGTGPTDTSGPVA